VNEYNSQLMKLWSATVLDLLLHAISLVGHVPLTYIIASAVHINDHQAYPFSGTPYNRCIVQPERHTSALRSTLLIDLINLLHIKL